MQMPDLTRAQIFAVLQWAAAQAVSLGYLDSNAAGRYVQVASTVLAAVMMVADAFIRNGRAHVHAATIAANTITASSVDNAANTVDASPGDA